MKWNLTEGSEVSGTLTKLLDWEFIKLRENHQRYVVMRALLVAKGEITIDNRNGRYFKRIFVAFPVSDTEREPRRGTRFTAKLGANTLERPRFMRPRLRIYELDDFAIQSSDRRLSVQPDGAAFEGEKGDLHRSVRATVELIKTRGEGVITITGGTEDYKMSVWAHARLMRMAVIGYNPIPHDQEKALELVDALRDGYARAGVEIVPYKAPPIISSVTQFYYQQHRSHLHDMEF